MLFFKKYMVGKLTQWSKTGSRDNSTFTLQVWNVYIMSIERYKVRVLISQKNGHFKERMDVLESETSTYKKWSRYVIVLNFVLVILLFAIQWQFRTNQMKPTSSLHNSRQPL